MQEHEILRQILLSEFRKARERNRGYSQRAFAKKLGVNSGTLSGLLRGKRKVSPKIVREILLRLGLEEEFRQWLGKIFESASEGDGPEIQRTLLDLDRFEIIAAPIHLNALNLLRTSKAEPSVAWLAKKLKKDPEEISRVVDRLERAKLLSVLDGKLVPTREAVRTPDHLPHQAIRAFHLNSLQEAAEKLEAVPVLLRDFSSITIPGDPERIDQVRELIRKFRDQVSLLLGATGGSEAYKLSVQFYPVASEQEMGPQ